jgi:hypothetical protein
MPPRRQLDFPPSQKIPEGVVAAVLAALIWLFGRACQYVLAGK